MKRLAKIIVAALAVLTAVNSIACDATKASAGGGGIVLILQPGVPQVIEWDMTDCLFGIQNFTIYATQPRPCPSCLQKNLHQNTPLTMELLNVTDGVLAPGAGFVRYGGTVSQDFLSLALTLSASAKKPLVVEVTTTGAFGGL